LDPATSYIFIKGPSERLHTHIPLKSLAWKLLYGCLTQREFSLAHNRKGVPDHAHMEKSQIETHSQIPERKYSGICKLFSSFRLLFHKENVLRKCTLL